MDSPQIVTEHSNTDWDGDRETGEGDKMEKLDEEIEGTDGGLTPTEKNRRRVEYILGESFTILTILLHLAAVILAWSYVIAYAPTDGLAIASGVLISVGLAGLFVVISVGRCCFFLCERKEKPKKFRLAIRNLLFVVVFLISFPLTLCCGVVQLIAGILLAVSGGANTVALLGTLCCLLSSLCAPFVGAYGFNGLGSRVLCPLAYE
jgi:hypothetical protein